MKKKLFLYSFLFFLIDRIIKLIFVSFIALGQVNNVITNFFYLTNVNNYGAAWSILNGNRLFLIVVSLVALAIIYKYFIEKEKLNSTKVILFSLLFGGIIGNLYDRIFLGYVVDYIGFIIFGYKFPIFNLADTFIVVSVILISFLILKEGEKND
jgi:signal peptidase II